MTAPLYKPAGLVVGFPLLNTGAYVLDNRLNLVPIGVTGELFISGDGLARGYLHGPAMTAERFVASPYGPPGARIYRTGDLARWKPDGILEFVGRSDDQIRFRGFRLEYGEIEAALKRCARLRDAAVAVKGREHTQRLVAYVVAENANDIDLTRFRAVADDVDSKIECRAIVTTLTAVKSPD